MPSVLSAVRDVTVGALLSSVAATLPDEEALVYCHPERRRWTFRTLNDDARLIARGLLAVGVKPGDRVAVWATNVPEWIILQFKVPRHIRFVDAFPMTASGKIQKLRLREMHEADARA
jgi:acyl-CoA synthetase (AMP-forming)/AMP-acid ligase II